MLKDNNQNAELVLDQNVLKSSNMLQPGQSVVINPVLPLQLSNDGDIIKLWDKDGNRIDWVNYTERMVQEGKPVVFLSPRDTLE